MPCLGREQISARNRKGASHGVHCDVTKEADVEALIAKAVKEFGRVDAVLNVAGIGAGSLIADVSMAD
jgi:NAD(P)-dependent dehydrogenase (short-subunit alcohol dehydrogenase family)